MYYFIQNKKVMKLYKPKICEKINIIFVGSFSVFNMYTILYLLDFK